MTHTVVRVTRKRTVDIVEYVNVDVIHEKIIGWESPESLARTYVSAKAGVGETIDWKLESETDRYAGNAGYEAKIVTVDGHDPEPDPEAELGKAPQPQADTAAESA